MLSKSFALSRLAYTPAELARPFKQEKWKSRVGDIGDHDRILNYWVRRRNGLSEREWTDFYELVLPLLMRTRLGAEYSDPNMRRDLINTFFADKILLNSRTTAAGPLENAHALHGYLKNFARDLARKDGCCTALTDDGLLSDHGDEGKADFEESDDSRLSLTQRLREAGIDTEHVASSADTFVQELDSLEVAYLSEHICADDDAREPVFQIAARLKASSYHYRAKLLGITRSKGETFDGYERTKIGRWMGSLGAHFNSDWQEEILILISILCERVSQFAGRTR